MDYLPFRNIRDVLGLHAKVSSRKTCLVFHDMNDQREVMSYLEFVGKTHQIANFLYEDLGLERGQAIAVVSSNHENTVLLYFAAWIIGLTVVAVNPDADDTDTVKLLSETDVQVLFASDDVFEAHVHLVDGVASIEGMIHIGGERREGYLRFEDLAANRPTTFLGDESGAKGADIPVTGGNERTARLTDVALITIENGQRITRTQGDMLYDARRIANAGALTGNQVAVAALPLDQQFVASVMAPLFVGAAVVLSHTVTPDVIWRLIVSERAHMTVLDCEQVAAMVEGANEHMDNGKTRFGSNIIQQDVKHFRYFLVPDALTVDIARAFEDLFGLPLIPAYTDPATGEMLTMLPITLAWDFHQRWLRNYNTPSVGIPLSAAIQEKLKSSSHTVQTDNGLPYYFVDR